MPIHSVHDILPFFLRVIFNRDNAFSTARFVHPNSTAISRKYASGFSSMYFRSLPGSIFRHVSFRFFGVSVPVSFSLDFHSCRVDVLTLNTSAVFLLLFPSPQYLIARRRYFISYPISLLYYILGRFSSSFTIIRKPF